MMTEKHAKKHPICRPTTAPAHLPYFLITKAMGKVPCLLSCQTSRLEVQNIDNKYDTPTNMKERRILSLNCRQEANSWEPFKRRRRKRQRSRQQPASFFSMPSLSLSIAIAFVCLISTGSAERHDRCLRKLRSSDYERDGVITKWEFANAVAEISNGAFGSDFSKLPVALQVTFKSLSMQRSYYPFSTDCINLDAPPEYLEDVVCQNIETAISLAFAQQEQRQQGRFITTQPSFFPSSLRSSDRRDSRFSSSSIFMMPQPSSSDQTQHSPSPPPFRPLHQEQLHQRSLQTMQQCNIALSVGDQNRDDFLNEAEYVRFLNQLSKQMFGSISFSALPQYYQDSFSKFADGGNALDVTGSKPGSSASDEQEGFLEELCTETIGFLNNPPPPSEPAPTAPVVAPTSPPATGGEVDCEGTIPRSQCNTALAIADLNRDDTLDETEYIRFVNRLNLNAYTTITRFSDLPANVQASFYKFADSGNTIDVIGSKPGQTASASQGEFLDQLCCEADLAADNPGAPFAPISSPVDAPSPAVPTTSFPPPGGSPVNCDGTISQAQCNLGLAIADLSRDNLLNEEEYVRFLNRLSGNEYTGVSFNDLPGNIIANYNKFATTGGQIDINGSKPGQNPTSAEEAFLAQLCCETDLAVQNPGQPTTQVPGEPSTPPPAGSLPPTFLPSLCRTAMASSDFDRDDFLSEDEYVRFLNRLTRNEFQGLNFDDLDSRLQDNFYDLADNDLISIIGSKPGQSPNDAEAEHLEDVCVSTAIALNPAPPSEPTTPTPVAPVAPSTPVAEPSPPPTFTDTLCRTAMASSDFNRDDRMNEDEYVRFLNRLTRNEFIDDSFSTLEVPLPQTFDKLKDEEDGQINIYGAKPGQDASEEQEEFIIEICLEVSVALDHLGETFGPTKSPASTPSKAPDQTPPTLPPGVSEVYNSFILSNPFQTAEDLEDGLNREGLNTAYEFFAQQSVEQLDGIQRRLQSSSPLLRKRKLAVSFLDGSDQIYLLLDSECPDSVPQNEVCQTAFANFRVSIDMEDAQEISDLYTAETQELIASGALQNILSTNDPKNPLKIVNASWPVSSTFPPTAAPELSDSPTNAPSGGGKEKKKSSAGPIVGGIFGGLLFLIIVGFLSTKFSGKFGGLGRKKNQTELDNDDDIDGEKDEKDDNDSDLEDEGSPKDEKKNSFGEGFGEKPEQSPGDTKGKFGRKKKNKESGDKGFGDDNAFGLEPQGTDNAFGNDADFGDYGFDEPSEVEDKADAGDAGSVGGNDNIFGDTPESPGWGNSGDSGGGFFGTAGQGWGASDPSGGAGDNFFGTSGFGEDTPKDEEPASGSEEESSYTSSEDSTYESDQGSGSGSGEYDDEGDQEGGGGQEDEDDDSYSQSSAEDDRSSFASGSTPRSVSSDIQRKSENMDAMIESGDYDGVAKAAGAFGNDKGSSLEGSSMRSDGESGGDSYSGSSRSGSMSGSASQTTATTRTEDREKRADFRTQVDALVRLVLPDEVDKVDAMMEQFKDREAELVSTLQTMQERTATQRARAAVHKSKTRPQRGDSQFRADGAYSMPMQGEGGNQAGTAAIAAASLPIPAAGMFDEGDDGAGFGDQDAFGDEGSYYSGEEGSQGSRSYYSGEEGSQGSRSYYSGEEGSRGSRSYYSGEEGSRGSRSYYSGEEGSRSQYSGSRSQYSGEEGSRGSRSQYSGSRSQYSGEEGSRGSRSQYSGSRSQYSGSRSQYSGEEGSRGSRSQHSGSRSQYSGSRSQYSGEEGSRGSRSQYSGDGSQGSRSQYSGEEGSRGSRSYYSGEEGSRGSRSNYSGEEGSYSGEEGSHPLEGDEGDGAWE